MVRTKFHFHSWTKGRRYNENQGRIGKSRPSDMGKEHDRKAGRHYI